MRLFAALPLPPAAREEFGAVLAGLRERGWPVRWVRADFAHLTLKFFGEVVPSRYDVIAEAVERAVKGSEAISVRFTEVGAFPTFRRPRVLWLGLDAPPALELLKDRVERAAGQIGIAPEGVPFRPHVTLGRVREGQRLPAGWAEGIATVGHPFLLQQAVLFESATTPQGAEYAPRLTLPLRS